MCRELDGLDKLTTLPHLDATGHSRHFGYRCYTVSFTRTGDRFHHL